MEKSIAMPIYLKCLLEREYPGYEFYIKPFIVGSVNDYLLNRAPYFICWSNPEKDPKWRSSGYGEDYEEGEDASFPVLGVMVPSGEIYTLSYEDKYYLNCDPENEVPNKDKSTLSGISQFLSIPGISEERLANTLIDRKILDPKGHLRKLLKDAFYKSLWEME
jgi:hypothetical protein